MQAFLLNISFFCYKISKIAFFTVFKKFCEIKTARYYNDFRLIAGFYIEKYLFLL